MEVTFTPSPDVAAVLNALLDRHENRIRRGGAANPGGETPAARTIRIQFADLDLPGYFSQADPEPRLVANRQLQDVARQNWIELAWLPGESGHLLAAVALVNAEPLYALLQREPLADRQNRLEALLLAERFRFPDEDWRSQAIRHTLAQVRNGKSPAPFSLTDMQWNTDLLATLVALPGVSVETPYRVFSVRMFNDSKRFENLKPALVRLARLAHPGWKRLPAGELLSELNLVPNPTFIHLAGSWQVTTENGEILDLGGFRPALGFPAAQTASIQAVTVHSEAVLCIENLTTFYEFLRTCPARSPGFAALCTLGNPSPSIRRLLRLVPDQVPIYLWADLDYGGFNILSQLRQLVRPDVQPYQMDAATFETYSHLACPLTENDARHLKRLAARHDLQDVQPVIQHLLQRKLKLEQEAISRQFGCCGFPGLFNSF
jgi:hypothetical protein